MSDIKIISANRPYETIGEFVDAIIENDMLCESGTEQSLVARIRSKDSEIAELKDVITEYDAAVFDAGCDTYCGCDLCRLKVNLSEINKSSVKPLREETAELKQALSGVTVSCERLANEYTILEMENLRLKQELERFRVDYFNLKCSDLQKKLDKIMEFVEMKNVGNYYKVRKIKDIIESKEG